MALLWDGVHDIWKIKKKQNFPKPLNENPVMLKKNLCVCDVRG